MNFDFNFWWVLALVLGYLIGSFTKRVGKANEIDQIIRDAAQIQANNRDLETANDKLNQTLFESTKENQRLLNQLEMMRCQPYDDTDQYGGKKIAYLDPPFIVTCKEQMHMREEGQRPCQTIED